MKPIEKKLLKIKESSWNNYNQKEVFKFSDSYKEFLGKAKTERIAITEIVKILSKNGFKEISKVQKIKKGDKVYKNFKGKSLMALVVGKDTSELRIVGSHVDAPRLDLKPNPIYEDSGIAMMQTHYYGGVKKYQWVNEPLGMYGVIHTKKGKKIEIRVEDPVFVIPDLLIHLARAQMDKKAREVVEGEDLNIVVGNIPINEKDIKEKVKINILKLLNDKYGIIEEDFVAADIELAPVSKPVDVGFDRAIIGGYGQDDRVCVYTSLKALVDIKNPTYSSCALFFDKEEIGSSGDTGAAGFLLWNFAEEYVRKLGLKITSGSVLENSKAISADVTAGVNPNYKDVHEKQNASILGYGVSIEKYGGSGGKYSSQEAHAEYMSELRIMLDKEKIDWQAGELGKIDCGGGGTIAKFMGKYGMDCVDAGPCILAMHSPLELVSKVDVYSAYRFYKAFLS